MTAIELEQVFDQLSPHQQHYFRFPDSEMVTFDKYRIVFLSGKRLKIDKTM